METRLYVIFVKVFNELLNIKLPKMNVFKVVDEMYNVVEPVKFEAE